MSNCCPPVPKNKKGFAAGIWYGLLPHTFCILFIVLSVIGATGALTLVKNFLLIPYFFWLLISLSLIFATISALIYLKKCNCCSFKQAKGKWKYLLTLYSVTILTNLLLFFVIFPFTANFQSAQAKEDQSIASLQVDIPCTGHAPLITNELKQLPGITSVKFQIPNTFKLSFDPKQISLETIRGLKIFQTFHLKN